MTHDRRFLACLLAGMVGALASRWAVSGRVFLDSTFGGGGLSPWLAQTVALVPILAGIVAVVITAQPYAGVLVAVPTMLLSALVLMIDFYGIAGSQSVQLVLSIAVVGLAVLPADAYAGRLQPRRSLDMSEALVAGMLVGTAYVAIGLLGVLTATPSGTITELPVSFWIQSYAWPFVAFSLTGLVAGVAVERLVARPRAQVGS